MPCPGPPRRRRTDSDASRGRGRGRRGCTPPLATRPPSPPAASPPPTLLSASTVAPWAPRAGSGVGSAGSRGRWCTWRPGSWRIHSQVRAKILQRIRGKAKRAGLRVATIWPRGTSHRCPRCGADGQRLVDSPPCPAGREPRRKPGSRGWHPAHPGTKHRPRGFVVRMPALRDPWGPRGTSGPRGLPSGRPGARKPGRASVGGCWLRRSPAGRLLYGGVGGEVGGNAGTCAVRATEPLDPDPVEAPALASRRAHAHTHHKGMDLPGEAPVWVAGTAHPCHAQAVPSMDPPSVVVRRMRNNAREAKDAWRRLCAQA
jgi:hypothetical protein